MKMIKIPVIAFLLSFGLTLESRQTTSRENFNKCDEFALNNGIHVVLCENFRMPTVIVGVIFHVGNAAYDIGKCDIMDIIAKNIIANKSVKELAALGISHDISSKHEYTEIFCTMHPKAVDKFLKILREIVTSQICVRDLDIYKKYVVINDKLDDYCKNNAVNDNMYSALDRDKIFNRSAFLSITEDDVKSFFERHYRNCPISIIVCGSIDRCSLERVLGASLGDLPQRKNTAAGESTTRHITPRCIRIENKYASSMLRYSYFISRKENEEIGDIFSAVIFQEIFRFFDKSSALLSDFFCEDVIVRDGVLKTIAFYPKSDVSIAYLDKMYDAFVDRTSSMPMSKENLAEIAYEEGLCKRIQNTNLSTVYENVKNAYLCGGNVRLLWMAHEKIKNVDPEQLRSFMEKVFRQRFVEKIMTRFRSDR
jgi:predicted Zn-dependent peptidase